MNDNSLVCSRVQLPCTATSTVEQTSFEFVQLTALNTTMARFPLTICYNKSIYKCSSESESGMGGARNENKRKTKLTVSVVLCVY